MKETAKYLDSGRLFIQRDVSYFPMSISEKKTLIK